MFAGEAAAQHPMVPGGRSGEGGYGNAHGMDSRDLAFAEHRMQAASTKAQSAALLEQIDRLLKLGQPDHVLEQVVAVLTNPSNSASATQAPTQHGVLGSSMSEYDRYIAANSPKRAMPIVDRRGDKIRQVRTIRCFRRPCLLCLTPYLWLRGRCKT